MLYAIAMLIWGIGMVLYATRFKWLGIVALMVTNVLLTVVVLTAPHLTNGQVIVFSTGLVGVQAVMLTLFIREVMKHGIRTVQQGQADGVVSEGEEG